MILNIAQHSFELDRLPERPWVLDVGSRALAFTNGMRALRPGAFIFAMEPDPTIETTAGCFLIRKALVGDDRTESRYASYSTGEGNFLTDAESYHDAEMFTVSCINIEKLMAWLSRPHWDLVKLDCEGSEFQILENWPGPIATQISVEFHDWDRRDRYPESYYYRLFAQLGQMGYRVVQHELSVQGVGCGHWDTLLVLEA